LRAVPFSLAQATLGPAFDNELSNQCFCREARSMAFSTSNPTSHSQPSVAALTARFLARRADNPTPEADACTIGVEPHEAISGFRTDTLTTWAEAVAAARIGAGLTDTPPASASWGRVSRQLPSRSAVAMCVGNFPQLLGDLSRLFAEPGLSHHAKTTTGGTGPGASDILSSDRALKYSPEWAILLNAAGFRLSGDFASAEATLRASESKFTGRWQSVFQNELAAILWDSGRYEDAISAWRQLPDETLKAFNLGMAALFTGHTATAKDHLTRASQLIPETSGWNHISRIYLALCEKSD
jgi:hypothetical protein